MAARSRTWASAMTRSVPGRGLEIPVAAADPGAVEHDARAAAVQGRQGVGVEHRARPDRSGRAPRARRRGCTNRRPAVQIAPERRLPHPGHPVLVRAARQRGGLLRATSAIRRGAASRRGPAGANRRKSVRSLLGQGSERQIGAQLEKEVAGPEPHRGPALSADRPGLGEVEGPLDREAPEVAAGARRIDDPVRVAALVADRRWAPSSGRPSQMFSPVTNLKRAGAGPRNPSAGPVHCKTVSPSKSASSSSHRPRPTASCQPLKSPAR